MNMQSIERISHPSSAQVEILVQFLEQKPNLSKGFLRSPSAKAKALKEWEMITLKLNSIGGTIKSVKKWMKYWSDKKNAVKKKACARAAALRETNDNLEELPELSEIEERIVALINDSGKATGDAHLKIQVFDDTPEHKLPEVVPETPADTNISATSIPRRRKFLAVRRSPPSQRQSQFSNITDKFLHLEEQRLALEHRVVTVMEQNVEVNRMIAQANIALGEGLKALADAIKEN